jgi:hypothetical protein
MLVRVQKKVRNICNEILNCLYKSLIHRNKPLLEMWTLGMLLVRTGAVAQVVEGLSSQCEALILKLSNLFLVTCDGPCPEVPGIWKIEIGSLFEVHLGKKLL